MLGQMMEATEAELQAVTEKTAEAAAAAEASFDQGSSEEEDSTSSGLLAVLASHLEDAEVLSRKRLEVSTANAEASLAKVRWFVAWETCWC